jgi:hypothetical protein
MLIITYNVIQSPESKRVGVTSLDTLLSKTTPNQPKVQKKNQTNHRLRFGFDQTEPGIT